PASVVTDPTAIPLNACSRALMPSSFMATRFMWQTARTTGFARSSPLEVTRRDGKVRFGLDQNAINRRTAEPCPEFRGTRSPGKDTRPAPHPERGVRNPRHPFRVRSSVGYTQAYAKNAYAWLISQHASGVRRVLDRSGAAESN